MNKIFNYIIKGLLTSFVLIVLGGFLVLNVKKNNTTSLMLVSSSLMNSIETNLLNQEDEELENVTLEEEVKEEIKTEVKEEPKLKQEVKVEKKEEVKKEENIKQEVREEKKEVIEEKKEEPKSTQSYQPNTEVVGNVLNTYYGNVTAYGPDCYGCTSGKTASGYDVLNGHIYYEDPTYGTIRIVAADRSVPFGTIVRLTGLNISAEPVIAIVLDRGGAIGFNKDVYFDLLYASEKETYSFGKQKATIEVLRNGY